MDLVNVVIPPLPIAYTYRVPDALQSEVAIGSEVEVPLGPRAAVGYVIQQPGHAEQNPTIELKSVSRLRRRHPLFLASQLEFFNWVADYYCDTLANVIETAVPPPVPQKFKRFVSLATSTTPQVRGQVEQRIIDEITKSPPAVDVALLSSRVKGAAAAIKRLVSKGVLLLQEQEILDQHLLTKDAPAWAKTTVDLSEAQNFALEQILTAFRASQFAPFLLHGVTGSGKTEVYIEAARAVLAEGRGVLVIVPEIALTPQLIDRFRARVGNQLAVLHSGLHPRVRWDAWRALLEGRSSIGIGARSAIFAPIENLGLIIVDEEHESSYKQQEGLRYHARDLALVRAKMSNCPIVMGSATPSLESYANAAKGKYTLLSLQTRSGTAKPPTVHVVDLNRVKPWEMKSRSISPLLHEALTQTLAAGNQAFILYNRRGFASYLQCERCESVVKCPNCSVTLTYHKNHHALVCHYCGMRSIPPQFCVGCVSTQTQEQLSKDHLSKDQAPKASFQQRGSGTERVFEELAALFPSARLDRLDRDAVSDGEHYRLILERMRSGETQILVGTQMIAKGHDLPGVTLVGVVDCDVGLHMPDFRAGERVFQLLTQVGGRAGRADKPGEVILQTRVPRHPSIIHTQAHDYESFARDELKVREALRYPPYTRMLRIVASSSDKQLGGVTLDSFLPILESLISSEQLACQVLGPCAAPIEKIKTLWRWHLLIKSNSAATLNKITSTLQAERRKNKLVRIIFDIDPQEML